MLAVLGEHYREWFDLINERGRPHFIGPTDQIPEPGRNLIGFGVDPTPPISFAETEYHLAIMRWVAIRIGKPRKQFEIGTLKTPVPAIRFGGSYEPVLVESEWGGVNAPWHVVDAFGVTTAEESHAKMAWEQLSKEDYIRCGWTSFGKTARSVLADFVDAGMPAVKAQLDLVRKEIKRLDKRWVAASF